MARKRGADEESVGSCSSGEARPKKSSKKEAAGRIISIDYNGGEAVLLTSLFKCRLETVIPRAKIEINRVVHGRLYFRVREGRRVYYQADPNKNPYYFLKKSAIKRICYDIATASPPDDDDDDDSDADSNDVKDSDDDD